MLFSFLTASSFEVVSVKKEVLPYLLYSHAVNSIIVYLTGTQTLAFFYYGIFLVLWSLGQLEWYVISENKYRASTL